VDTKIDLAGKTQLRVRACVQAGPSLRGGECKRRKKAADVKATVKGQKKNRQINGEHATIPCHYSRKSKMKSDEPRTNFTAPVKPGTEIDSSKHARSSLPEQGNRKMKKACQTGQLCQSCLYDLPPQTGSRDVKACYRAQRKPIERRIGRLAGMSIQENGTAIAAQGRQREGRKRGRKADMRYEESMIDSD